MGGFFCAIVVGRWGGGAIFVQLGGSFTCDMRAILFLEVD